MLLDAYNLPCMSNLKASLPIFSDLEKYNEISKQPIREAPQIIDIVKPIGRWTNFIIKQKLSYLYNFFAVRKDDNKPYWQTVIDAQAKTQGKDKGKGR